MIVLLDTTVLIDTLRLRPVRGLRLKAILEAGHTLATSAINIGEVYAGLRRDEERLTGAVLSGVACYVITRAIARRAGELVSGWARSGRTLALPDMIVAATALEHGLPLMTDNRRDFPMPELQFFE